MLEQSGLAIPARGDDIYNGERLPENGIRAGKKYFYIFTLTTASGFALVEIIKYLVQRARPYNLLEQGYSFPSAHATIVTIFLLSSIFLLAPLMKKVFTKSRRMFMKKKQKGTMQ